MKCRRVNDDRWFSILGELSSDWTRQWCAGLGWGWVGSGEVGWGFDQKKDWGEGWNAWWIIDCLSRFTALSGRRLIFSHVIRSAGSADGSLNQAANDFLMQQRTAHFKGRRGWGQSRSAVINSPGSVEVGRKVRMCLRLLTELTL